MNQKCARMDKANVMILVLWNSQPRVNYRQVNGKLKFSVVSDRFE
jgi:hypothetical protein